MMLPDLTRIAICTLVLGALAGPICAQPRQAIVMGADDAVDLPPHAQLAALTSPALSFAASEAGTSRIVKGAPYSAEAVSESTQVLMDGNRIQKRSVQRLARDGEGRTRMERLGRDGTVESVLINDVVAGRRYWLMPDKKRAFELPMAGHAVPMHVTPLPPLPPVPPPSPGAPAASATQSTPQAAPEAMTGDEARSWAEDMRRWAHDLAARLRDEQKAAREAKADAVHDRDAPARVIVAQAGGGDGDGRTVDIDAVRVSESANDAAEGAAAAIAALPPVLIGGPTGEGVTTVLGSKEFDRVRADGSRTTWTIPAGKIGNEKPIEVVSERWYSPDLLLVVSSRYFDPRRGETTYRLAGLKRAEPDAALFQVPADYERRPNRAKREERGKN